jgi:hypothetical protein
MAFLENKDVITRKEHCCFGCGRKFPKGSKLNFSKTVDGGEFSSAYWCKTCSEYWYKYMSGYDEIGFGELKSEDSEGWERTRNEVEAKGV